MDLPLRYETVVAVHDEAVDKVARERPKAAQRAALLSITANVALLAVKLWAFLVSGSKAVLASLADSVVDILSQLVIFVCYLKMKNVDPRYPVGKARLETVGAILTACIMTIGAVEVIQTSGRTILNVLKTGEAPKLEFGPWMFGILIAAIGVKGLLFLYCYTFRNVSATVLVLAEDHRNDVISNSAAVAAAVAAGWDHRLWWIDPVAGIAISVYIVASWIRVAMTQIDHIVGRSAPDTFIQAIKELSNSHNDDMEVDVVRAYHFGHRFFVEVEVVFPPNKTVEESHDIAVNLQQKVEALEEVERAFVHVDYQKRDAPEHVMDWTRHNSGVSRTGTNSSNSGRQRFPAVGESANVTEPLLQTS